MAGYTRVDTINNIADGNVINAADLDGEFDGIQAAFNASTGHNHDGTAGEGAPILALGPVQDVTISASVLGVKTTNTVDLGTSSLKFKDFYLAGAASIGGTLGVTGTITAAAANFSGAVALNGNTTIGDADTDTITQAASYVTGTQLKSAKTDTNTLSLAAYDVDGTAYTNLITLTAGNTPTLALTSTGVGTINNMSIGATTASTGAFTTLSATGVATFSAGSAASPAITTTGDTNTGIFFPAADTIAFSDRGGGGYSGAGWKACMGMRRFDFQELQHLSQTPLSPEFIGLVVVLVHILLIILDTLLFKHGGMVPTVTLFSQQALLEQTKRSSPAQATCWWGLLLRTTLVEQLHQHCK
jgi:hypothetical protein